MWFDFEPLVNVAFSCGCDCAFEEEFFVDVARIEGDEVLRELCAEVVDLCEDVWHVYDVAHGEGGVNLFHVGPADESEDCADGVCVSSAGHDVEL